MIAIAQGSISGREDLNSSLITVVLNILVQLGIDNRHNVRAIGKRIDFITNIEIIQRCLQHKGGWFCNNTGGSQGCLDQHVVNFTPGQVIAQRHFRVQDKVTGCQTWGGTWRTEVSATVTLGPSWPEGTPPPPRWCGGYSDAQIDAGALRLAPATAAARLRARLAALRLDPTPTPAPEVPLIPSQITDDLLSYCAGVSGGAKDTSVFSWLRAHKITRVRAEELLEQLVTTGRLRRVERPVAGGEVVVRYLPVDPATPPAPLPVSDAPPEETGEPPAEEPLEEPVLLAGTPAESCPRCADMEARVRDLTEGNAGYREQILEARRQCEEARQLYRSLCTDLAATLGESTDLPGTFLAARVRERLATQVRPTASGDALRQYLLLAPDETWSRLARARAQLAEARALQERATSLQAAALASLDGETLGLMGEPQESEPPPSGETVRDAPAPLTPAGWARRPVDPATGERAGTARDRILKLFLARPEAELTSQQVGEALQMGAHSVTGPLSTLARDGKICRIVPGLYRLARRRRAA